MYFRPDKIQDQESQTKEFYRFSEKFFQKILDCSDELEVDFIGVLLMWQVSGANTSSVESLRKDVRDEQVRAGTTIAEDLIGSRSGPLLINALRARNMNLYYAMARLQGPVSLGIHDIETIMIARGLVDLQASLPDRWNPPRFFEKFSSYVNLYRSYEELSNKIVNQVQESNEAQEYLSHLHTREKLKDFLSDGDKVDAYQFIRTTVFWANVSELSHIISIGGYNTRPEIVESLALENTIDSYLAFGSPTSFFLDQIANPKMIKKLKKDASNGSLVARKLLEMCGEFDKASDQIIAFDRNIAADLVDKKTEQNLEFQIFTGVSYARWLLNDAYKFTHGHATRKIAFDNPHDLAFHAFLGTGNRETGPSYQLAGSRPLNRATLPFLPPEDMFKTMNDFIENVYQKFEKVHPQTNFKTFARYLFSLFEERYFVRITGTNRYLLDDDSKMGDFIHKAIQFGAYKNVITLPHCSWARSLEATIGYIAEVTKDQQTITPQT